MLKYKLENKLEEDITTTKFYCEICGKPTLFTSIKEFHKDGNIIIHSSCSDHIVDLYNKILEDQENK